MRPLTQPTQGNQHTMRNILSALALMAVTLLAPYQASAQAIVATRSSPENPIANGTVGVSADYTNATVTASDVTGLSITLPATQYSIANQFYRACYSVDALKATATSGTLTLNVNGSDVAVTARFVQFAGGREGHSLCYTAARPTAAAFIVKLRGVSADTNVFTVYAGGQLSVQAFNIPQ